MNDQDSITDKRTENRIPSDQKVMYADYQCSQVFPAQMFNYSTNGMYLESSHQLDPGTGIGIKVTCAAREQGHIDHNKLYRAEVIWCQSLTKESTGNYGIGVKFCRNYDHLLELIHEC